MTNKGQTADEAVELDRLETIFHARGRSPTVAAILIRPAATMIFSVKSGVAAKILSTGH